MCWWAWCFIRELPLLTVEFPGVWHVCGTIHWSGCQSPGGEYLKEGSSLSRGPEARLVYPLPWPSGR
jgi:hypothetical protein